MKKKAKPEVQPKKTKADRFIEEYKALCDKYQMRIVVTPAFKTRDDGTYSVVLQTSVGKMSSK